MVTDRMRRPVHPAGDASCGAPRHGTSSAYQRAGCRCPQALREWRNYKKRRAAGIASPEIVEATGTRRRLQALHVMGHSRQVLGEMLGTGPEAITKLLARPRVYRSTARRVAALYDELSMVRGASAQVASQARRAGFASPLAWDDIDHDPAPAAGAEEAGGLDEVAIVHALAGDIAADRLRADERREAVRRLAERDLPSERIAVWLGLDLARVQLDRDALRSAGRKRR